MRKFIFVVLLLFISCKDKFEQTTPTLGSITESVYASGVVKSENQYTVFATVSGILKKIDVVAGQTIVKDQLLFELENDKAELNTENARLAFDFRFQIAD